MKKLSILFIILILLSVAWWYMVTHPAVVQAPIVSPVATSTVILEPVVTSTAPTTTSTPEDAKIVLDTLKPGDTVNSPLTITGKARGTWYFEGSFPVELRDSNNVQLAIEPATAQTDWMTTDWVSFSTTLNFSASTTGTGILIFHRDNPSDNPALDESYQMVVNF